MNTYWTLTEKFLHSRRVAGRFIPLIFIICRQKLGMICIVKSVSKWMSLYKWPLYDLFWSFFCHMCVYLSQNWGSDGHFEVLNGSKFWLGQKLWHELQIFPFLFFLPFCTKTDICIFFVFCIFVSFVITFVPIKI